MKQAAALKPETTRRRNPKRTRRRIFEAAFKEFAAKGFTGARVDSIASRAGVNKRMLYIYFGDKKALLHAIMRGQFESKNPLVLAAPNDPAEALPYWHKLARGDVDWIRLLQWEALSTGSRKVVCEEERRGGYVRILEKLRRAQADGFLNGDYEPEEMLLAMLALSIFPVAFPQIVRLVIGRSPLDRKFEEKWLGFLHGFAEHLRPYPAPADALEGVAQASSHRRRRDGRRRPAEVATS